MWFNSFHILVYQNFELKFPEISKQLSLDVKKQNDEQFEENSKKFFDSKGHLRRISGLNFWPLKKVLVEKYRIKEDEATCLADFLLPMLSWNHETRASAQEMLQHPWLQKEDNYDFKYTDREYEVMMLKKELKN